MCTPHGGTPRESLKERQNCFGKDNAEHCADERQLERDSHSHQPSPLSPTRVAGRLDWYLRPSLLPQTLLGACSRKRQCFYLVTSHGDLPLQLLRESGLQCTTQTLSFPWEPGPKTAGWVQGLADSSTTENVYNATTLPHVKGQLLLPCLNAVSRAHCNVSSNKSPRPLGSYNRSYFSALFGQHN